jgi:hypothetical protein
VPFSNSAHWQAEYVDSGMDDLVTEVILSLFLSALFARHPSGGGGIQGDGQVVRSV